LLVIVAILLSSRSTQQSFGGKELLDERKEKMPPEAFEKMPQKGKS
jgi:hypothetical protein